MFIKIWWLCACSLILINWARPLDSRRYTSCEDNIFHSTTHCTQIHSKAPLNKFWIREEKKKSSRFMAVAAQDKRIEPFESEPSGLSNRLLLLVKHVQNQHIKHDNTDLILIKMIAVCIFIIEFCMLLSNVLIIFFFFPFLWAYFRFYCFNFRFMNFSYFFLSFSVRKSILCEQRHLLWCGQCDLNDTHIKDVVSNIVERPLDSACVHICICICSMWSIHWVKCFIHCRCNVPNMVLNENENENGREKKRRKKNTGCCQATNAKRIRKSQKKEEAKKNKGNSTKKRTYIICTGSNKRLSISSTESRSIMKLAEQQQYQQPR